MPYSIVSSVHLALELLAVVWNFVTNP